MMRVHAVAAAAVVVLVINSIGEFGHSNWFVFGQSLSFVRLLDQLGPLLVPRGYDSEECKYDED